MPPRGTGGPAWRLFWCVAGRGLVAAACILILAWIFGWQSRLGRIDPAFAIMWMPPILLWQVARLRAASWHWQIGSACLTLSLLLAAQTALVLLWSEDALGHLPQQLLVVALWASAIFGLGHFFYSKIGKGRGARWLFFFAANILLIPSGAWLLGQLYAPSPARADAPRAVMLSSLPLRWSGSTNLANILIGGERDDPALQQLERLGPLRLLDSFNRQSLKKSDILFLAHPRALSPVQLVAIDEFIQNGGQALILADALSSWHMPHALGDARNPPVTSLLTPLFDHWGVELRGVAHGETGEHWIDDEGRGLRLLSAGRFTRFPESCVAQEDGYLLRCRIGKGQAIIMGDADYLQARNWQGFSHLGWHLVSSDAISWTAAKLWGAGAGQGFLSPIWLRQPADHP